MTVSVDIREHGRGTMTSGEARVDRLPQTLEGGSNEHNEGVYMDANKEYNAVNIDGSM